MGSNSRNYIIAARVTQGHEEWRNASVEEKQEIFRKWNILKANLKKKKNPGQEQLEHMHTFVNEHKERKRSWQERRRAKKSGSSSQVKTPPEPQDSVSSKEFSAVPALPVSYTSEAAAEGKVLPQQEDDDDEAAEQAELEEAIHKSVAETSRGDPEQDEMIEQAIRASIAELDRARISDTETDEDAMKRAMQASLEESQRFRHSDNPSDHEQDLQEAMRRSMLDSGHTYSPEGNVPPPAYEEAIANAPVQPEQDPAKSREYQQAEEDELRTAMDTSKASYSEHENRDAATSQEYEQAEEDDFQKAMEASKTSHEEHSNEMTRQKTEEEIVMEYVRRQSLLEEEHRQNLLAKGKERMTNDHEAAHEADLKKAIALSMRRDGEEGESSDP